MGNEKSQSSSSTFGGLNIGNLEKDLGMILSDGGESSGKGTTEQIKENETEKGKSGLDLSFFHNKMQIPETPEEIKRAAGVTKVDDESDEGSSEKDTGKQEKGGEDVVIKEDSPLYLHAATLHEKGILPTLDLESLKGKPFNEAMQILLSEQKKYIDEGRNEYLNSLNDRQKEFLEMIELGIPQEQVEHQMTIEDAYSKVTDQVLSDDIELQKQIIQQDLKLKGLSDTQVQRSIKASEESETLFEDSKESRNNITSFIANQKKEAIDSAKAAQVEADKKEENLQKEIKATIDKLDEILPGIKVSANEKIKLYDYMTKPVEEKIIAGKKVPIDLINKERSSNPVLFDLKLKYLINLGFFKEDNKPDLTKIMKKVTSSNADKLSQKLKEEPGGPDGKGIKFEKEEGKQKQVKVIFPQFK